MGCCQGHGSQSRWVDTCLCIIIGFLHFRSISVSKIVAIDKKEWETKKICFFFTCFTTYTWRVVTTLWKDLATIHVERWNKNLEQIVSLITSVDYCVLLWTKQRCLLMHASWNAVHITCLRGRERKDNEKGGEVGWVSGQQDGQWTTTKERGRRA